MSDFTYIKVEWDAELAVVTIDRADKLNALNSDVIRELWEVFANLRDDNAVRGIVLTGAGHKAFAAGADVAELARMTAVSAVGVSREGPRVFQSIERFPKPVVAAVRGYALGGGLELALACHLRVASTTARFGLPEVGLGLIPGYGGTVRLARVVGLGRAVEIALTGDVVEAERALAFGLVSVVVDPEALLAEAKALLRRVTKNAPMSIRVVLESIYRGLDSSLEEGQAFESALFGLLASTSDMKEGLDAFIERRPPVFEGR
jgi:enoyl-CoA hydratase